MGDKKIQMRFFNKMDYQTYSGCEGTHPMICGDLTVDGFPAVLVRDENAMCVVYEKWHDPVPILYTYEPPTEKLCEMILEEIRETTTVAELEELGFTES